MSQPPPLPSQGPMQVEPLGYYTPSGPARPGILVAVGVISIILAILSILSACSGVAQAILFRSMPIPVIRPPTTAAAGAPTPAANTSRMTPAERQTVVIGLNSKQDLSTPQLEMLDLLLMQRGDDVLPFAGSNITQQSVAANVSASGTLTATDGVSRAYYILANGRIEVGDNDVSFSPAGNAPSVRINRNQQAVVTQTTGQSTIMSVAVGGPTVMMATANPQSNLPFVFSGVMSFISLGLAILLLVAGIQVLRQRRSSRRLHLLFAWFKIPLAFVGAYASGLMMQEYLNAMSPALGTASISGMLTMQIAIYAVFACIYPVALIIVMNTRTVRNYYQHLTVQ